MYTLYVQYLNDPVFSKSYLLPLKIFEMSFEHLSNKLPLPQFITCHSDVHKTCLTSKKSDRYFLSNLITQNRTSNQAMISLQGIADE